MSKIIKMKTKKIKFENKSDKFIGFTNANDDPNLNGKAIYLNINNIVSIFNTDKKTTVLHNGVTSWEVLETLEEVINRIS